MGAASLVLGILSIIAAFCGSSVQVIGIILAIIGIVLGAKAKKIPQEAGMGKGGLVCSIIGLILCSLTFIFCVACSAIIVGILADAGLYL